MCRGIGSWGAGGASRTAAGRGGPVRRGAQRREEYQAAPAACRDSAARPPRGDLRDAPALLAWQGSCQAKISPRRLMGCRVPFEFQAWPMTAHHEVVDAKRFTVTRDLFLHECRVTDDETVAGEAPRKAGVWRPDRPQDAYASYLYCRAARHSSNAVLWLAPT